MTSKPAKRPTLAYVYIAGVIEGPLKIGYTGDLRLREYHLQRDFRTDIVMRKSWPVMAGRAQVAEHYAHWLLREYHIHREWFDVSMEIAGDAIAKAVVAADHGMELMPRLIAMRSAEERKKRLNAAGLTPEIKAEAYRLMRAGLHREQIAEKLGVSKGVLYRARYEILMAAEAAS